MDEEDKHDKRDFFSGFGDWLSDLAVAIIPYIFIIFFFGMIIYTSVIDPYLEHKEEKRTAIERQEQANREAKEQEETAKLQKEIEETTIVAKFLGYKFNEWKKYKKKHSNIVSYILSQDDEESGDWESYIEKYTSVSISIKNPVKGKIIEKVALSVIFREKEYSSHEYSAPTKQYTVEIDTFLQPNTINNLTFKFPQPNDISFVLYAVKLERVIHNDGTVLNWNHYYLQ